MPKKSAAEEAVVSAEVAKVEEHFHCTACTKPGYKLDSNLFNEQTGKLTHHFVDASGQVLDEACGGKQ